ncbi:hypothetical protein JX265_009360 [Neoarthrinium moseri]|uniref:Pisatin demethylase n=1 Tax=Neoarthrinium moseri TaxID=1658444 RepID=A0A9P9WGE5_9PEZI|nr:hypothetical protein JX265_009360 [Neoarthrinium moseri]
MSAFVKQLPFWHSMPAFGEEDSDTPRLIFLASLIVTLTWLLITQFNDPLRKYPGPFIARYTNLWRLYQVTRGDSHLRWEALHRKYGPVVRVGPNLLDLDHPSLVKTIYNNFDGKFIKNNFYRASSAIVNGKITYNIFSMKDPKEHARQRRPIDKFYTMKGILSLEDHVNDMVGKLCSEIDSRFAKQGVVCDLGEWIGFYAWDVVGKVTFSQPFGYMQHGRDFDGTLAIADKSIDYFSLVSQMPFLDHWLDKNPVMRVGPPGFGNITRISLEHLAARYKGTDGAYHDVARPDFLDRFIEAKGSDGDVVDDGQIISYLMINMIAGADTTAVAIRSLIYHVLKHPGAKAKLVSEIRSSLPSPDKASPIAFAAAKALPYLEAAVRESQRIFPSVGLTLERVVPASGLALPGCDGARVPGGVHVGINPYVVQRTPGSVWGAAPDAFDPGRWLRAPGESEDGHAARLRAMNAADLSFGGGSRGCIGKNLALVELYKVVATLFARYDMELEDPQCEWEVVDSLFMRQTGLRVKLTPAT